MTNSYSSDPTYDALYRKARLAEGQRDTLTDAQFWLSENKPLSPQQTAAVAAAKGAVTALGLIPASGGDDTAAAVSAYVNFLDGQVETTVKQLYSLDEDQAYNDYPEYLGQATNQITAQRKLGKGGAGEYHPPVQAYSISVGPGGDIIRSNSVTGAVEITGQKVPQGSQIVTNARDGHAYAVDKDTGDRIDLGVVAFPEVDPAQKFRFDVLTAAATVEQSFAALDLQERGMMIKAAGDDMARQVEIGAMVYQEAQVNLNRINTAFTQRREERAQMLKYAVTRASLTTNAAGERVTQLPFSSQLGSILGAATGQKFSDADFQLGVGAMNPDQTAQDVLGSSAFDSPIPALAANLTSSRAAIEGILGKQAGSRAASDQIVRMALPNGS